MKTFNILILSGLAAGLLSGGCARSVVYETPVIENIIDAGISGYRPDHYRSNHNYKVFADGKKYHYCCIAFKNDGVVYFNKLVWKEGRLEHEPHGHLITTIRSIQQPPDVPDPGYYDDDEDDGWFLNILFDIVTSSSGNSGGKKEGGSGKSRSGNSGGSSSGKRPGRQ